jgi:hypothetical protein
MDSMACTLHYGSNSIPYELFFVSRKSLEIAVHPNKAVIVKAPIGIDLDVVQERVKKRARWIKQQVHYFDKFDPRTPERMYIGGESHLYLGRKYRLKIEKAICNKVLLKNGYFYIYATSLSTKHIESMLNDWYRARATIYFENIFSGCWNKFKKNNVSKPSLKIQKMKKRWGSLSKNGTITLNLDLIQTPKECIEYVLTHELCHLVHHNHGPEFYKLLDRSLPDWVKRKHKLEMSLI